MITVATQIARNVWAAMLWFMRRPWVRRLQRNWVKLFPEGPRRDQAWAGFRRQERFARKYGLRILTWVVTLCLTSLALLFAYNVVTWMIEARIIPTRDE
ncbi:MAG: hypothetical protein JST30_16515 [Armatimonadetes bacterium]|nr:hypothetical protein [Armatimonadota bacterium]